MPVSVKKTLNPPDFDRLSELFKLLSDRSRLHILWCICQGEYSVGEISAMTGLSQANVSKHLQMLRLAGIVSCRKEGNSRIYTVADPKYLNFCAEVLSELSLTSKEVISSCEE